jgi:hypothetical protein
VCFNFFDFYLIVNNMGMSSLQLTKDKIFNSPLSLTNQLYSLNIDPTAHSVKKERLTLLFFFYVTVHLSLHFNHLHFF